MKNHLSKKTREDLEHYIPYLMTFFGLVGWQIDLKPEPLAPDSGAYAEIDTDYTIKHAGIKLCWEWENLTAKEQRDSLVHELTHVLTYPLMDYVAVLAEGNDVALKVLESESEHMVHRLTQIISMMVDPPHGKSADKIESWHGTRFTTNGVVDDE